MRTATQKFSGPGLLYLLSLIGERKLQQPEFAWVWDWLPLAALVWAALAAISYSDTAWGFLFGDRPIPPQESGDEDLTPADWRHGSSVLNIGDVTSDLDPVIDVDCRDGRVAVLSLSTNRPTKLKAQGQIMAVREGEIERGDAYPLLWRDPGSGSFTTHFQDLKPSHSVTIALARVFRPMSYMGRNPIFMDLLGDGGVVQRIEQEWPKNTIQVEVSVNVFGGKFGALVHAHHYVLTSKRGSNVITVRPEARPKVVQPPPGVRLANSLKR